MPVSKYPAVFSGCGRVVLNVGDEVAPDAGLRADVQELSDHAEDEVALLQ